MVAPAAEFCIIARFMNAVERLLHRPIVLAVVPFIGGIVAAEGIGRSSPALLPSLAILVASLILSIFLRLSKLLIAALFVVAAFGAGIARHSVAVTLPTDHVALAVVEETIATVRGRVSSHIVYYAEEKNPLDDIDELVETANGSFTVDADCLTIDAKILPVSGKIKVSFYREHPNLRYGDDVELTGKIKPLRPPTNPGGFDYRRQMIRQGVGATLTLSASSSIDVVSHASLWDPRNAIEGIREEIRSGLFRLCDQDLASFLSGLILGFNEPLFDSTFNILRQTGTAHFVAISGFHFVLVFSCLWFILVVCGVRGKRQTIWSILVLLLYTLLTGLQVSVIRAFIMAVIFLCADLVLRKRETMNTLSLSAIVILAVDPAQLFSIGFQLTYLAVLGIVYISPIVHAFLYRTGETENGKGTRGIVLRSLKYISLSLSVSFAAWIATAPVMAATFNMVTPVILIANLLITPFMLLLLLLGFLLTIILPISSAIAFPIVAALDGIFRALQWTASALAELPMSYFYQPDTPLLLTLALYAFIIAWIAWNRLGVKSYKALPIPLAIIILSSPLLFRARPEQERLTMLDVGEGNAIVIEYPDGKTILYDAGSRSRRDVGKSVVAPFLWRKGIVRIDAIILSHPDADHINGVKSICERFAVERIFVPTQFDEIKDGKTVVDYLARRAIPVIFIGRSRPATTIRDGINVISPPDWKGLGYSPLSNDLSLVLKIPFGGASALLTGDIEGKAMETLLASGDNLSCAILQAPHHAKKMAGAERFASAVAPAILLVSADDNSYSHAVIDYYRKIGARICITAHTGAITLSAGQQNQAPGVSLQKEVRQ